MSVSVSVSVGRLKTGVIRSIRQLLFDCSVCEQASPKFVRKPGHELVECRHYVIANGQDR